MAAAGQELLELKFRLSDGSDIGPYKYAPATTIATLKESIIAQWPQEKENGPKSVNDMKLINAGKVLENNKTLSESRVPVGELPGGVITMHVVVRPPSTDKGGGKRSIHPTLPSTTSVLVRYCNIAARPSPSPSTIAIAIVVDAHATEENNMHAWFLISSSLFSLLFFFSLYTKVFTWSCCC
ncbi:membrane-anchored ubiquitin-fold protein 3 isoform X1 [Selaginella moellendorffii]|uniref:membrane-anchored ubiquitin-fold protein 3 isoform X1 n=1 Tax=Selaginella moellendorffii TaxID=88036 RepID=UPI000D1CD8FD|nr:membrane-anchored ubiquitin-fold protein 3 isoform X1 [Selaginella moellendorffii]|eukprot:XP_024529234.1 membrane-anchored ubiquitin-fold protein 3 isoform X1 [Selaginella moellendorffii]